MKSPTYILGVNESHCATAALLRDGELIAAASEERFTGIKNQAGFPKNAISYCLKEAGVTSRDLASIDLSFLHPFGMMLKDKTAKDSYKFLSQIPIVLQYFISTNYPLSYLVFNFRAFIFNKFFLKNFQDKYRVELSRKLKVSQKIIHFRDHQTCHAYSAYYSSKEKDPAKKSLVITCDGAGDFVCSRIFIVKNNEWEEIASTTNSSSIGMLYYYVTKYLGMRPNEHEYKVMGLAPYVKPIYGERVFNILKNIMRVKGLTIQSDIPHVSFEKFLDINLKGIRFDEVASGIQLFTEYILVNLVKNSIKKTKISSIYAAGGVFMNVKANMLIANLPEVKNIFIMPSAADESTAIGAAYVGYQGSRSPLKSIYLGPSASKKEIETSLKPFRKNKKYKLKVMRQPAKEIAKLISNGEIVARCVGKMEFGQRALGNRSILARADNPKVIKIINEQIKGRDFWMPFAPVILKERAKDYLINLKGIHSPYMMLAFETTGLAKKELIAGLHAYDETTRPQILSNKANPGYYAIVKEFERLTGIGGLLNTSFNLHGMPIVCSSEDAIYTFKNSGLRYLVLENYLIEKL